MTTARPSNQDLVAGFRALLTTGFYPPGPELLEQTKPWRGDLWKAFKEIETRLCPSVEGAPR